MPQEETKARVFFIRKKWSCMKCTSGDVQRECLFIWTGSWRRWGCWCRLRNRPTTVQRNISLARVGRFVFVNAGTCQDADGRTPKRKTSSNGCTLYDDTTGGPYTNLPTLRTTLSIGTVLNFHRFRSTSQKNQKISAASRNLSLTPPMRATQTRLKLRRVWVTTTACTAVLQRRALRVLRKSWFWEISKEGRAFFLKNFSRNSTCYL